MSKPRVDYTRSFFDIELRTVDFDSLKPKPAPTYRVWHLISHDSAEKRHIWAHQDELGWHGWPIREGQADRNSLFTTYPVPGWKEDLSP